MEIQDITVYVTAIVAVISLAVSLLSFWHSMPKLKIVIANKQCDCFYGKVNFSQLPNSPLIFIAGAKFSIINNSPVAITIGQVKLKIGKHYLPLIDKTLNRWAEVEFIFPDHSGLHTTDGSFIDYKCVGLSLPVKLGAYDTLSTTSLFHNFPSELSGKVRASIIMETAIGTIKKRVALIPYDKDYPSESYKDFEEFSNSIEVEQVDDEI